MDAIFGERFEDEDSYSAEDEYSYSYSYNSYFVQNPEEYICSDAMKMLENMLHLSVLKAIQNHPSLKVRENATMRFVANGGTRAATVMLSGTLMGSTEGCESVPRMLNMNRDRCTNCFEPMEITSLGRPDKRRRKCCSQPTCLNMSYDNE